MPEYSHLKSEDGLTYINRRYATALLATATLLLLSQVIIQFTINNMKNDARVVNIAGRQRMLSQKLTKCSFGLMLAAAPQARALYTVELESARNLWQMNFPGDNSPAVQRLYEKMEPHYQAVINAVAAILHTQNNEINKNAHLESINTIRDNEDELLLVTEKLDLDAFEEKYSILAQRFTANEYQPRFRRLSQ